MTVHRRKRKATGRAALLLAMLLATAVAATACAVPEQRDKTGGWTTAPQQSQTAAAPEQEGSGSAPRAETPAFLPWEWAQSVQPEDIDTEIAGRAVTPEQSAPLFAALNRLSKADFAEINLQTPRLDNPRGCIVQMIRWRDGSGEIFLFRADDEAKQLLLTHGDRSWRIGETALYEACRPFGLYIRDAVCDLYDVGCRIDIRLSIRGKGEYEAMTFDEEHYRDAYITWMGGYIWQPTTADAALYETAGYHITIAAVNGSIRFVFFEGTDTVLHCTPEGDTWYALTRNDGQEPTPDLAGALTEFMRFEYDGAKISATRAFFACDGSAEQVAERFVSEVYGELLLNGTPGGTYTATDYEVIDWKVSSVSEDGRLISGWYEFAVRPEDYEHTSLWAGNSVPGTGKYEGWLCAFRYFDLEKLGDGVWHCTGIGTGR